MPSRRLDRPSHTTAAAMTAAPAIAKSSLQRKASARWCVKRRERSVTTGTTSSPTWALEEIAISLASRIFPLRAMTIAPPCSAALPTTATITIEMKNSQADRRRERTERMDEDLADPSRRSGGDGERDQRRRQRPGALARLLTLARALSVALQVAADDRDIEEQQHNRHDHRGDDDRVPLGRSCVAEGGREREGDDGGTDQSELHEQRAAVDPRSVRARNLRDP